MVGGVVIDGVVVVPIGVFGEDLLRGYLIDDIPLERVADDNYIGFYGSGIFVGGCCGVVILGLG